MELQFEESLIKLFNNYVPKVKDYNLKSKDILNGVYPIHQGLDKIYFNQKIDWSYKHKISSNTYQLYLHTLNFTKSLVYTYIETGDVRYIKKAKNIFEDWIIHNTDPKANNNPYAWYDHTVSSRLTNLLFFQINAPEKYKVNKKTLEEAYIKHIDFLVNDANYPNNNHGIMMDRSIIIASIFIKNISIKSKYINIAKKRVENAILRDYSYMNTHLENSPDYHVMVTSWLTKINDLLKAINFPLQSKYQDKLKGAVFYNSVISNYSNQFPMLGDTSAGRSKEKKSNEDFVDLEAGIAVFNDKTKKSTLVFNCGFQNRTHKHRDDLSLVFSINNEEIFVDSGKYNYMISDPIRKHMVSPAAHTSLYIQDKEYELLSGKNLAIKAFITNKDYKYVAAINNLYNNVKLTRHVILINGDTIVLFDEISSKAQHVYVQNFILGEQFKCNKTGSKTFEIFSSDNSYNLKEHSDKGIGHIYYGEKNKAVISKKFNKIIDVNRIELKKKTTSTNFITTFSSQETLIDEIKVENSILNLVINKKSYKVSLFNE